MSLRNRTAYFKAYNAARRDSQKAYQRDNSAVINFKQRERRKSNIERFRKRDREYYAKTEKLKRLARPRLSQSERSQRAKQKMLEWNKNNHTLRLSYGSKWRASNRNREKRRAILYRLLSPEKSRESARKYNSLNPSKARTRCAKRRAIQHGSTVGNVELIERWMKRWKSQKTVRCYWCSNVFFPNQCQSDHVIPLTRLGPHSIENLCISCKPCNQSKYNKPLSEWSQSLRQGVML